jgi:hypothetical protein
MAEIACGPHFENQYYRGFTLNVDFVSYRTKVELMLESVSPWP